MAGPYRAIPAGNDWLAGQLKAIKANLSSQQTAAGIRNSKITGGSGLTVEAPNGQAIQLLVASDGTSEMLFTPPTADQVSDWAAFIGFDPDGSYGGGELVLKSPQAPVFRITDQPAQTGFINLVSGDGTVNPASVGLAVTNMALQVLDSLPGLPPAIYMGLIGNANRIEDDASSWRLFGGFGSLVFPYGTAEARIRDGSNAAYIPIRASAFTVTSTREAKQDITDLDWPAVDVVLRAPAQRWRYRPEHADPERIHFGPMAEDLPAELVDHGDLDVPGVNQADLLGVAWAAIGELAEQNRALTARVDALEAQLNGRSGRPAGL